jgi:prolyl oligopeptidase
MAHEDDLRWLEPPHDKQARAWAREATQASSAALQRSASYPALLDELRRVNADAGQVAPITLTRARAIRLHKSAQQPKGLLQVAAWDGQALGEWRTVLDVGALGGAEGRDLSLHWQPSCLGPDGERCLLMLHEHGGDEAQMREFDLAREDFVVGGFVLPRSRMQVVWVDADTLLLGHTLGDAPRTVSGWPAEALLWRRGSAIADAHCVLRLAAQHALFLPLAAGGKGHAVVAQAIDYSTFAVHVVSTRGDVRRLALPASLKLAFGANADHVFAQLAASAPLGEDEVPADSVVAAALQPASDQHGMPFEVVKRAGDGEVVDAALTFFAVDRLLCLPVRRGLELRLDLAQREQGHWQVRRWIEPQAGVNPEIVGAVQGAAGFSVMRNGFLVPPCQEFVTARGERVLLQAQIPMMDTGPLQVEARHAKSADGQAIDYYLVGPRRSERPVPTLMTGYGAFGISLFPAYFTNGHFGTAFGGATLKLWLERGGALVVPAIRGGGEHGAAWHAAAMRELRQRSYDDFHAVASALTSSGYTTREHLGVFGLSNGGLLAAVAGTQRPDLYGAIVSDVPLADMLRFPELGMGAAWIDEYGDPSDPQAAAWLAAYSPVHNVRRDVAYPPFLITVATSDNRVGPGHARKLAKRLMQAQAQVYFLEPEEGGHGVSDPLQQPEVMAMRAAFFVDRLMGKR